MNYPVYGEHVRWLLGFGAIGLFLSIVFWIVIVCLIVMLIRRLAFGPSRWRRFQKMKEMGKEWQARKQTDSALALLNERYVKGEIGKQEYEEKKRDILG